MTQKMYVCPECNVAVKHLKPHISRMHPDQGKPARSHHKKEEARPETKGKKLELKTPPKKEEKTAQGYHCVDCGGPVSKGQNGCSRCGAKLDWRGLL